MDDFSDLAARIGTSVGELRGVLILSRDGLVLGSFPDDDTSTKPAWIRFATMGDPEKAFVEFAVAGVGLRPGLLLEQLEQAILVAEEARSKREGLRVPEAPVEAPKGKPRTPLHPEQPKEPVEEPVIVHAEAKAEVSAEASSSAVSSEAVAAPEPAEDDASPDVRAQETPEPAAPAAGSPAASPAAAPASEPNEAEESTSGDEGEIDRVLLAQEFSRLLQESGSHDEETP